MSIESVDVAVVGAGAAGLMAAIVAAREAPGRRVIALDGARTIGAKILVAGGGRCNVTHHEVSERDYAGGSPHAIKQVLRSFGVRDTVAFFKELGVELKREDTGKLFPTTDSARTVLNALLAGLREAGGTLSHPSRVTSISRKEPEGHFLVELDGATLHAGRVILATGGMALPKSGSDGGGYPMARALGHSLHEPIVPALAPLVVMDPAWIRELSGVAVHATITLVSSTGRHLLSMDRDVLCTHFGLSGPGPMDVSRHWQLARLADRGAHLLLSWRAGLQLESVESSLRESHAPAITWLRELVPERLARALLHAVSVPADTSVRQLSKDARRALATIVTQCPVRPSETRGFPFAEATAGGVPLGEVKLATMESRPCPGLYLCGEILDVDGRIGGFNFQWAWSSGTLAGRAAARSLPPH